MDGGSHLPAAHGDHSHGDVRTYVVGFLLSVILTAGPFALIMSGVWPASLAVPAAMAFAAVQIIVHLVYFLHMNSASTRSWNMAALVFTVIIVAIVLAGSLWVMYHMNANMMPGYLRS